MGLRPCQRVGDLGPAGFSRNHGQIGNPYEDLRVWRDNVEMRRTMIVCVHSYTHGVKAMKYRHERLSNNIVQLLHYRSELSIYSSGRSAYRFVKTYRITTLYAEICSCSSIRTASTAYDEGLK